MVVVLLLAVIVAGVEEAIARGAGDTRSLKKRLFKLKGPMVGGYMSWRDRLWPSDFAIRLLAVLFEVCRDWK